MYAVIETGGKQYRVAPGESIEVETLTGDVGAEVEFDRVVAVMDGDAVKAGSAVSAARVKGTITAHGRGEKTWCSSSSARSSTSAPSGIARITPACR